jgi:hypothetical protein
MNIDGMISFHMRTRVIIRMIMITRLGIGMDIWRRLHDDGEQKEIASESESESEPEIKSGNEHANANVNENESEGENENENVEEEDGQLNLNEY